MSWQLTLVLMVLAIVFWEFGKKYFRENPISLGGYKIVKEEKKEVIT